MRKLTKSGSAASATRFVWLCLCLICAEVAGSDLVLDGEFAQGGLIRGYTDPGGRVLLDGRAVRVSADGQFLLGFGREAKSTAVLEVRLPNGEIDSRQLQLRSREYPTQRIDGLPDKMVTPSQADLARIKADQVLINATRRLDTETPYFASGFAWPAMGIISGVYGSQRILNGKPRRPHYGVDIAAPEGTPVRAPADGVIALVHNDMYYTGGTIIIDHGHGLSSAFLHLSEILIDQGAIVKQGDVVAKLGATGRATGPHLDWRMNLFGVRVDPAFLVGPMPAKTN